MRKFYLAIASCVALVAFMGFSASAFANDVFDSDCAADPDAFELSNFTIDTPDSQYQYEVSGITGTGRACGSRIHNDFAQGIFPGVETLNDTASIKNAAGVKVNAAPSADLPKGSYIGEAQVDALTWIWFFGDAQPVSNSALTLRVEDRDDPITPPGTGFWLAPDCPANSLACYRGKSDTGHGWIWVVEAGNGSTTLTIGRFYNDVSGEPAGLTEIDFFSLCGYAGDVGGISCGDDSDTSKWLQKNGTATTKCNYRRAGIGRYTVSVTNLAGATTAPVTARNSWKKRTTSSRSIGDVSISPTQPQPMCLVPRLRPDPTR